MTPTFLNPPFHCTREEFRAYVNGLNFSNWIPKIPYAHNTGVPSLKQWLAMGATPQERWGANLNQYYRNLGWHAGPHIVVCPDYIWVLCDLTKPGVAESCSNSIAFGAEMVGNYEIGGDDFSTGDGAKVADNACYALAVVAEKMKWGDLSDYEFNVKGLHFHHDCVQDHHACPGSKVTKPDMLVRIAKYRSALSGFSATQIEAPPTPVESSSPMTLALNSVDDIQAALNTLGIEPIEAVDGVYGPITISRIKNFQAAHGCFMDGWTGPQTDAAIIAALKAK